MQTLLKFASLACRLEASRPRVDSMMQEQVYKMGLLTVECFLFLKAISENFAGYVID